MSFAAGIPGAAGNTELWRPLNGSPRAGVLFIVTHDSWGPYGSGRNGAQAGAAEWWVLADGTIIHATTERVTAHCGQNPAPGVGQGCNNRSVGIEFEGYLQKTEQQIRSGLALIRFLQERYCIKSKDVHAHRKAGNGAEGVVMEQAARNMNYNPNCTGTPTITGDVPDGVVRQAVQQSLLSPQPTPAQVYQQSQPVGTPYTTGYPSSPVQGSSYITGSPSPYPSTAQQPSSQVTTPSPLTTLTQIAYPDLHGNESDAASDAAAKKETPLKDSDKVTVITPNASTTIVALSSLHDSPTPNEYASTTDAIHNETTFGISSEDNPAPTTYNTQPMLFLLLDRVKVILQSFLSLLSGL